MLKILGADKDTYITDRVIDGTRQLSSNVGLAGSLDLFKLRQTSNIELSRLLIHFDLSTISSLHQSGKIDISNPSFFAILKLSDVYGGQTTPEEFDIHVYPLSASFSEGRGRDVSLYSDIDTANFLSSSTAAWVLSGCASGGGPTDICDYITASLSGQSFLVQQHFIVGNEDLSIDVTAIVSASLTNEIPNSGFRLSLSPTQESDAFAYFVKRFASRQAFDKSRQPELRIGFNDSIQDDILSSFIGFPNTIFVRNYFRNSLTDFVSASTSITGSDSVMLRLETPISGGILSFSATGSQHAVGSVSYTGIYSASVTIPASDANVILKLQQSGSVKFTPIWSSLDGTVAYHTGSAITFTDTQGIKANNLTVTANVAPEVESDEIFIVRVNIFDQSSPFIMAQRLPIVLPSVVFRDVYYAIRDVETNVRRIPFDTAKQSTLCSSDDVGMYFELDVSNLIRGRTYVVDMLLQSTSPSLFHSVSREFRVI